MNKWINVFVSTTPLAYERKSKFFKERPLGNGGVVIQPAPASPHCLRPPAIPASSPTCAHWRSWTLRPLLALQALPVLTRPGPWAWSTCSCPPGKFLSIFKIQFRYYFLQGDLLNLFPHIELITPNTASLHGVHGPGAYSYRWPYFSVEKSLISQVCLPVEPVRPHLSSISSSLPPLLSSFLSSVLPFSLFFLPSFLLCLFSFNKCGTSIYSIPGMRNSVVFRSSRPSHSLDCVGSNNGGGINAALNKFLS